MSKVFAIQGVPTLADFSGHSGTPLVIARFASEITVSAITAKAGSVVFYQQVV